MPKAPSPPPPINPTQTADTQQQYNIKAGQDTQALNTIGQNTAVGNLTYTTSIDPITGLPKYVANSQYNAPQQALYDAMVGSKNIAGQTGQNLWSNISGNYQNAPDFVGANGTGALVNQQIDAQLPAWERFNAPARAQLDTALRNQGLLPGMPGYQQQVDALTNQQQLGEGQWLSNFEPQAFSQAVQQWQLPEQMAEQLTNFGSPSDLKGTYVQTPNANIGAADYGQYAETAQNQAFKNYQQKVASQNAQMQMMVGLGMGAMGMPVNPMKGIMGGTTPTPMGFPTKGIAGTEGKLPWNVVG